MAAAAGAPVQPVIAGLPPLPGGATAAESTTGRLNNPSYSSHSRRGPTWQPSPSPSSRGTIPCNF